MFVLFLNEGEHCNSKRLNNLPYLGYLRSGQAKIKRKMIQSQSWDSPVWLVPELPPTGRSLGTEHLGGFLSLLLRFHFHEGLCFYHHSSHKWHFSQRTHALGPEMIWGHIVLPQCLIQEPFPGGHMDVHWIHSVFNAAFWCLLTRPVVLFRLIVLGHVLRDGPAECFFKRKPRCSLGLSIRSDQFWPLDCHRLAVWSEP